MCTYVCNDMYTVALVSLHIYFQCAKKEMILFREEYIYRYKCI